MCPCVAFRLRLTGTISWRQLGGAIACVAVGFIAGPVSLPALAVAAIVLGGAGRNCRRQARRRARGEPSPLEREVDLVAEALEQLHDGAPGLGEQRVVASTAERGLRHVISAMTKAIVALSTETAQMNLSAAR